MSKLLAFCAPAFACAVTIGLMGGGAQHAHAALIVGFETAPLGAASHGQALVGAYELDDLSVRFGFDKSRDGVIDTAAVFERAGRPIRTKWGFVTGPATGVLKDTELHPHEGQLGDFFIRHKKTGKKPPILLADIASTSTVDMVRGEIWDINGNRKGTERWRVRAYNDAGDILDTLWSPIGKGRNGPYDGRPWTFEFTDLDGIAQLEIKFVGTKKKRIGYAFDNFVFGVAEGPEIETDPDPNPEPDPDHPPVCPPPPGASVPEPTTAAVMGIAAMMATIRRRRRWAA